ncbi:MAG: hypothetical protein K8R59_08865 [Thermoanaerobaculales bacterium]|nr:hypothetical protein [Thermoanaerobaculales bacterium]
MPEILNQITFLLSALVIIASLFRIAQVCNLSDLGRNWLRNCEYELRLNRLYGKLPAD